MADSNRFSYDYSPINGDPPVTQWVKLNLTPPHYQPSDFRSIDDRLHRAKTQEAVMKLLSSATPSIDINSQLVNGDTPLHVYIRQGDAGYPLLLALMSHSDPDVLDLNPHGEKLNTPLHVASELNNLKAAAALIAFGANVCSINYYQQSPLDLARNNYHSEMVDLLFSIGSELGSNICTKFEQYVSLPHAPIQDEKENDEIKEEVLDWKELSSDLEGSMKSLRGRAEDSYSAWLEWKKRAKALKETTKKEKCSAFPIYNKKKGERVLFLDGGGVRGLIQTEVLSHITEMTGRTIPELFDWIVGTSTGGIVALALVYAPMTKESFSVPHLRKLYFEIKDKVFGSTRLGLGCDTDALESILKREFKDMRMTPVPQGTKVLISAVDKSDDKLEVCWFNNCLNNNHTGELIWKVGRYTSAAPCYFKPMDDYVDGGLKVNNPSEDGMTLIQDHLRMTRPGVNIMLAVSIGCGIFPSRPLGDADIEKYLFFGAHWLKPWKFIEHAGNLVKLLAEGINNSDSAANNTRSRCQGQGIPFYRFSPTLDQEVPLSEINNLVLIEMILKARAHISSKQLDFDMMIQSFYQ